MNRGTRAARRPDVSRRVPPHRGLCGETLVPCSWRKNMFWAIAIPLLALTMLVFGWVAGRESH